MSKCKRGTFSSREIRRMNEREKSREDRKKAVADFMSLPVAERQRRIEDDARIASLQRNGITIEDLDKSYHEGYDEGARIAAENTLKNIFAAVALVLHEDYDFDDNRCMDVLNAIDQKVIYALDSREMVQQVWDDLSIEMRFDGNPLDERIVEKEAQNDII